MGGVGTLAAALRSVQVGPANAGIECWIAKRCDETKPPKPASVAPFFLVQQSLQRSSTLLIASAPS